MTVTTIIQDIGQVSHGYICHQVNCKGIMGAGVAKVLSDKYPDLLPTYKSLLIRGVSPLGTAQFIGYGDVTIVNIFGQYGYGRNKRHTNYESLATALESVANTIKDYDVPIYIPYGMSCGLAGAEWPIVYAMIDHFFAKHNVLLCSLRSV